LIKDALSFKFRQRQINPAFLSTILIAGHFGRLVHGSHGETPKINSMLNQ
jgi:hypothetical protein